MASNTENLNLLMKNPSTDGADTFNVQTMLNENWQKIDNNAGTVAQTLANILKPTTPPIIGLPPSTTPNDMFNVLAHAGDLHVWRKTVTTSQEIPAGYTLGASAAKTLAKSSENSGNSYATFYISSSISVDDAGNVTMNSPATVNIWQGIDAYDSDERAIFGKFIKFYSVSNSNAGITSDLETGIYFIPNSAEFTRYRDGKRSGYTNISACQKVNTYPLTPAGTTTTYPVSTNRNAYQEGNDAKPAGYTLGEPKTTVIPIHPGNTIDPFYYGDVNNVAVTDDGVVSVSSGTYVSLSPYNTNNTDSVKGKYIQGYPTGYPVTSVYYIPADATFSNVKGELVCDKAQLVTGYAAIPANTTIEYLGCLGDKARVQVVSYVGTGTYGSSNPNSLTFDFAPKMVIIRANGAAHVFIYTLLFLPGTLTKTFQENGYVNLIGKSEPGLSDAYARVSGRTLDWYAANSYNLQANYKGAKYTAIAIG